MPLKKEWKKEELQKLMQGERNFAGDRVSSQIFKMSKRYIGSKVLDVGAGSGALIDLIPNAVGMDLVPQNDGIIEGSITEIPFDDECFDTIFATEVLEHLDDEILDNGLEEVYRCLRKGGFFIITVPYKENITRNSVTCPHCGLNFHRVGHVQSFDENAISQILKEKKFDLVKLKVIPIAFMTSHKFAKYFVRILMSFGFFQDNTSMFIVAKK